ncbi:HTH-type transcriptional activator IlvY [Neptuniibacter sp. CAU 1671]|uniref:HTH-type transcriptional activator IlvY n=1 Tax=Neptuniibacter sp. CAU 1671 TaxID=3032593 RepID=UPI0023DAAE3D|nr:HTH-type transcriptional activator IlvY [Neptuniibacter sp. CAU 1671]MDF2182362.1 HTH-type transcriptional activator IlvY [Neptuniibacter sp. CAU 1671]
MDIKQLRQFLILSECLHFGKASEACHVSPSALSRSIKQLEDELGTPLFERDNRSVAMTGAGMLFQSYARDALGQWDLIRTTLMQQSGELQGELSIYCSVTASYSFLFEILSRFRLDFPSIEIKLHTGDPEHAIPRVMSGEDDFAIAAKPSHLPNGLAFKQIAISPLLFIGPKDPGNGQSSTEITAETPMILSEEGIARKRVDQWFRQHQIKPRIYAQVAGNEAIVSMVSLGFGVGVVPQIVLQNSPLAGSVTILPVEPELEPYEVGIVTLNKKLKNPLISAFWSQLQAL